MSTYLFRNFSNVSLRGEATGEPGRLFPPPPVPPKNNSFYCVCYNFWTIYGDFSFFLTT